jgi:hypothetical protein
MKYWEKIPPFLPVIAVALVTRAKNAFFRERSTAAREQSRNLT